MRTDTPLLTPPGVFRPRSDSWLLADAVGAATRPGDHVADVCTGSGVIALSAARAGAGRVVAIDVSRRAVATAVVNAAVRGLRVVGRRGDLLDAVGGERFDLIASNPPYVPATDGPVRGAARAWEGGPDGRAFLDRLIAAAPGHLRPGGRLLVVHSSLCGTEETLRRMAQAGLAPALLRSERGPVGPIVAARAAALEAAGVLEPGEREEDVVLIEGRLTA